MRKKVTTSPSKSNSNGRALEYKIVDYFCSEVSAFKVTLTPQAKSDLKRDEGHFIELSAPAQQSYARCAEIVHDWLAELLPSREIIIHKITDQEARAGDVTDIRILSKHAPINLSIKHNHKALKHQRPPTAAIWCGYAKKGEEDVVYRNELTNTLNSFLVVAKKALPTAINFRDLLIEDPNYINSRLYAPVCDLVAKTLSDICKTESRVVSLFQFLVGNIDFYKIIDSPKNKEVIILDFTSVSHPKKVIITRKGESYINLAFSNGWIISMRLHTASSRLGKSLKFDTQPVKIPVPEIIKKK